MCVDQEMVMATQTRFLFFRFFLLFVLNLAVYDNVVTMYARQE